MSSSDDQSLASLLTLKQQHDLSELIVAATEQMRAGIVRGFESKPSPSQKEKEAKTANTTAKEEVPSKSQEKPSSSTPAEHSNLSKDDLNKLQSAALAFFDGWRDKVLRRVQEVLKSEEQSSKSKDHSHAQRVSNTAESEAHPSASPSEEAANSAISMVYPPISTPTMNLSYGERLTIINALLLMLLSLESYNAHSRSLLLRLTSSLHVPVSELTKMEKAVAVGLLDAASHMDASSSTQAAQQANATSRKWKVGLASVAGAALVGITGGLAAPLVAAGVGGLMGGLGLGATAAAGYLGTLAGSGVLVGSLFGAYGGRMTGKMMDEYAKEVEDFAFLPLYDQKVDKSKVTQLVDKFRRDKDEKPNEKEDEEAESARAKQARRLRVTIGISGWLIDKSDVVDPWDILGDGGEPFALRWELEALLNLGNAIQGAVKSAAWSYIKVELLKQTVFAGLMAAAWPIGLLHFGKVLDNPFNIAKRRADKAGAILADALINKAQGERPVSLVAYSLGARLIFACLKTLADRKAFGLIDSVVMTGTPVPSDAQDWKVVRSVVSGRLVNVHSKKDYILGFLYRTSSVQYGIAGLQPVEGVDGVENLDVTDSVTGHLKYRHMIGQLLGDVGWADLDDTAIEKERQVMKADEEEEARLEDEAKKRQQEQEQEQKEKGQEQSSHDTSKDSAHEEHEKATKQAEKDSQKLHEQLAAKVNLSPH